MNIRIRPAAIDDYDGIYDLWNSAEQTRRAMNPVDDSRAGIERYVLRNPSSCFLAFVEEDSAENGKIAGVILAGHDGRRGIIHHLCVHPDCRRMGIARTNLNYRNKSLNENIPQGE